MTTVKDWRDPDKGLNSLLAGMDHGIKGRIPVESVNVGDRVFARYYGDGYVVKQCDEDLWEVHFGPDGKIVRYFNKRYLYKT